MAKQPKFRSDGEPDGRGHAEGSKVGQFAHDDGRRRPGRPKGAISLKTIYMAAAAAPVTLIVAGKKRKISSAEAIVLKQKQKAIEGDPVASHRFISKIEEYSPSEVAVDRSRELMEEDAWVIADARRRGVLETEPNRVAVPDPDPSEEG